MKKISLFCLICLLLAACNPFAGEPETPTPEPPTPTPVVIELPTPTPLPVEPPASEAMVSLLDTAAPPTEPLLEEIAPVTEAAPAVQMPRFSAGNFSFVPPAGWTVIELGEGHYLVQRPGDDLYTGAQNSKPYIYLKATPAVSGTTALLTALDSTVLANLAGVQTTEPPQGIVIDGVTGVWQFARGRNDNGQFRAYLMVIPTGDKSLSAVIQATADDWPALAPEMAQVLETMRFPEAN